MDEPRARRRARAGRSRRRGSAVASAVLVIAGCGGASDAQLPSGPGSLLVHIAEEERDGIGYLTDAAVVSEIHAGFPGIVRTADGCDV